MTGTALSPAAGVARPIPGAVRAAAILFAWLPPLAFVAVFLPRFLPAFDPLGPRVRELPALTRAALWLGKLDPQAVGIIGLAVVLGLIAVDAALARAAVPYNRLWLLAAVAAGWLAFFLTLIGLLLPAGEVGGFDV